MSVCFVTCKELPEPDVDEALLLSACSRAGIEAEMVPWDGDEPNGRHPLLIFRSTWNYHLFPEEFLSWVARQSAQATLFNPPRVIRGNVDKRYLARLAEQGVPVVPTRFFTDAGADLPVFPGAERVVVKPVVSAASFQTRVFPATDPAALDFLNEQCGERAMMVQPFLSSVEDVGERSVIWIDGEFTHAIRKSPRFAGDEESVSNALEILPEEIAIASRCLEGIPERPMYARFDFMRGDANELLISEMELIEPSLFLREHRPALDRLVSAIGRLLEDQGQ